jgi:hypothetical protein
MGIGGLVRVPGRVRSLSTTALKPGARAVATAGLTIGGVDLLDGAVRVRVVRPPTLTTEVSTKDGGRVRYAPAVLEVSGDGIKTSRLDTPGDIAEVTLGDVRSGGEADGDEGSDGRGSSALHESSTDSSISRDSSTRRDSSSVGSSSGDQGSSPGDRGSSDDDSRSSGDRDSSANRDSAGANGSSSAHGLSGDRDSHAGTQDGSASPATGSEPDTESATRNSGSLDALLSGQPKLGASTGGTPLPLPVAPELPKVDSSPESAQIIGSGTRLRISVGAVREATSGRAIAARATAFKIAITQSPSDGYGDNGAHRGGVLLDLDVGVLEAAAVVPEPNAGAQSAVSSGGSRGLPIGLPVTGPAAGALALCGVALVIVGVVALRVGLRRRRFRA